MTTLEHISKQIRAAGMAAEQLEPMETLPGGKGDGKADEAFDPAELAKGIKVEMEHTQDANQAKEIAKDHLSEVPEYYQKLEKMEKEEGLQTQVFSRFCARPARLSKSGLDQSFEHRGQTCEIKWTTINEKGTDTTYRGVCSDLGISTKAFPSVGEAKAAIKREVEQNEKDATHMARLMSEEEWKKQPNKKSASGATLYPAVIKGKQTWVTIPDGSPFED